MRLKFHRIAAHPTTEPLELPDGAEGIQFLHGAMDEYVEVRYYTKEVDNEPAKTQDDGGQHQRARAAVEAPEPVRSRTKRARVQ